MYRLGIVLGLVSLLLLTACDAVLGVDAEPTPTLQGAIVPTRFPTETPPPTLTITASPTSSPIPTQTSTSTDTPAPTATPTQAATATPKPPQDTVVIGTDDSLTTTGTINDAQPRLFYQFEADAGDIISVQMNRTSGNLDPLLELQTADETTLISNDDATADSRDAYIQQYRLDNAGTFTIVATRFREAEGPTSGDYSLVFQRSRSGAEFSFAPQPIAFGETVSGTIDDVFYAQVYAFSADAGDTITLQLTADAGVLDPYLLLLYEDERRVIAENDDSRADTRNARLAEITLPETGRYLIVATRLRGADGVSSGAYTLTLDRAD